VITNTSLSDSEWKIFYNVMDPAGNEAIPQVRTVRKDVEDILKRLEYVERVVDEKIEVWEHGFLGRIFSYIWSGMKWVLLIVAIIMMYHLLPRLFSMIKVMSTDNEPTFVEFNDAYDLYYFFTRPWWTASQRAKEIQIQYRLRQERRQ